MHYHIPSNLKKALEDFGDCEYWQWGDEDFTGIATRDYSDPSIVYMSLVYSRPEDRYLDVAYKFKDGFLLEIIDPAYDSNCDDE